MCIYTYIYNVCKCTYIYVCFSKFSTQNVGASVFNIFYNCVGIGILLEAIQNLNVENPFGIIEISSFSCKELNRCPCKQTSFFSIYFWIS